MASDSAELHWAEGLFLQPHHFQYQQRALDARHAAERRLTMAYDYGLIDAQVFEEGLANKVVRFDRMQAVMPGGQLVRLGDNAELEQLDVSAEFDRSSAPLTIWLALPVWTRDASNVIDGQALAAGAVADAARREPRQFKLERREWRDENTGDNAQELLVRRYNARLVAGAKPPNNFTSLPVLRLVRGTGQKLGQPVVDETFVPTCLLARGWPRLLAMAEEIAVEAESNREVMARLMRGAGFHPDRVPTTQVMQVLRLMLLGRYAARLATLGKAPACRPVDLFMEMRGLLAELQGLRPDVESPPTPDFDHDAPGPAMHDVYLRIRQLLAPIQTVRYREAAFELKDRVLVTALEREELTEPCEFMIGVDSIFDAKNVADFVEDRARFKVMSPSTAYAGIPGVKVVEERAPVGLPVRDKRYFFRLYANADQFSTEMWKRIATESVVALNWRELADHHAKKSLVPTLFVVRSGQRQAT